MSSPRTTTTYRGAQGQFPEWTGESIAAHFTQYAWDFDRAVFEFGDRS